MPPSPNTLSALPLLTRADIQLLSAVWSPSFELAAAISRADSAHLHIKVDDTAKSRADLEQLGWRTFFERSGFVELASPQDNAFNISLSSIAVSTDDARHANQPRPFLDHIGFDFHDPARTHAILAELNAHLAILHWPHTSQGGNGQSVSCCFATVAEKLWIFPPFAVSIEFSFGEHRESDAMGADLRPAAPPCCAAKCCNG